MAFALESLWRWAHRKRRALRLLILVAIASLFVDGFLVERSFAHLMLLHPAVLASYQSALERRDLAGTEALFATDNVVAESGKLEGSYTDYVANHIDPELGHFKRFAFSDYVVRIERAGDVAWATETYRNVIELNDKAELIERQGLSTTVLQRIDGGWKIRSMHSSSRVPKPPAP